MHHVTWSKSLLEVQVGKLGCVSTGVIALISRAVVGGLEPGFFFCKVSEGFKVSCKLCGLRELRQGDRFFFFFKYKMLELLGVTSQFRAPLNRVYMNM